MDKEQPGSSTKDSLDVNKEFKEKTTEVYVEWEAPSRTFVRRGREFFINLGVIVFFISIIFLIFAEFVVVITLWVIFGALYVFSTVEPDRVKHRITNKGIEFAGHLYEWHELKGFYFSAKGGSRLLNVDTVKTVPGRLFLVVDGVDTNKLFEILREKLEFVEDPVNSWFDKTVEQITEKFSLD